MPKTIQNQIPPNVMRGYQKKMALAKKLVVEGKSVAQAARELNITERMAYHMKRSDEFRQAALYFLENSDNGTVQGAMKKLLAMLEAKKPVVTQLPDGSSAVTYVEDTKTQMEALKELNKIYGIYAPEQRTVEHDIAIHDDAAFFNAIAEVARACGVSAEQQGGTDGYRLAQGEQTASGRDAEPGQRAVLPMETIFEPDGQSTELAIQADLDDRQV